jgi:RNA polymerase sigma-70 factor (ECF subfamily)
MRRDQNYEELPPFRPVDEAPTLATPAKRPLVPSFPEVFQQHAQFLWRTLMNLGVPAHEAQDLCQEVMLTVHRKLPDFDGQSLRGWLYGICVRVASDYRRSARVRREVVSEAPPDQAIEASQGDALDHKRRLTRLLAALDQLDEGKRAAFVLHEIEELTLAEISEALQTPIQTVYSRIRAAHVLIQRAFEQPALAGSSKGGILEAG